MRGYRSPARNGRARLFAFMLALCAASHAGRHASAQTPEVKLPDIFSNDIDGKPVLVKEHELCDFELALRARFERKDAPDEIIAFAFGQPTTIFFPESREAVPFVEVLIYGKEGEVRWYFSDTTELYFHRTLSADDVDAIKSFISENKVDDYPELDSVIDVLPNGSVSEILGGSQYAYLHLKADAGKRVLINNPHRQGRLDPPPGDRLWPYIKLSEFFGKLADPETMELRTAFARPIKDLEALYAHPAKNVVAVWKQEEEVCMTLREKWGDESEEHRILRDGKLAEEIADPRMRVEWMKTVGDVELGSPRASSDDRYVVGNRWPDGEIALYDSLEKRFVPVADTESSVKSLYVPLYYLDAQEVFLVGRLGADRLSWVRSEPEFAPKHNVYELSALDPLTGKIVSIETQLDDKTVHVPSYWFQRLPRRLQTVEGHPHIFWVAGHLLADNASVVSQFDTERFESLNHREIPFAGIETKDVWVDESNGKLYLIYKGHLLRIPFATGAPEERDDEDSSP